MKTTKQLKKEIEVLQNERMLLAFYLKDLKDEKITKDIFLKKVKKMLLDTNYILNY